MPKCKVCEKKIDTKNESYYKFGKDHVCQGDDSESTCVITYCYSKLTDPEQG